MSLPRRSFLAGVLSFAIAPSIVRAQNIMRVSVFRDDTQRDDTQLLQRYLDSGGFIPPGQYTIASPLVIASSVSLVGAFIRANDNFVGETMLELRSLSPLRFKACTFDMGRNKSLSFMKIPT